MKTYIIAEIGVNHNGNVDTAKGMIIAAKFAGADAVKFQAFKPEYNAKMGTKLYETLRKTYLSFDKLIELQDSCNGTDFIVSPFDMPSLLEVAALGVKTIKIPSGKITDYKFLEKVGGLGKKVILSTGMSTIDETAKAVDALVDAGTHFTKVIVLHCTSAYPTPYKDVNLRAMYKIRDTGLHFGLSDHTLGIETAIAAVAMGAEVIEKHVTMSNHMDGPDHKASLEFYKFGKMVDAIRNVEVAMGDGIKRCQPSERVNLWRRKSLL
jgi:N,N'-diacetyllegionaminate synthase